MSIQYEFLVGILNWQVLFSMFQCPFNLQSLLSHPVKQSFYLDKYTKVLFIIYECKECYSCFVFVF